MLRAVKFLLPLLMTGTAAAHDFWLQPRSWQIAPGVDLPFVVEVGHGPFRQQWGADPSHLLVLRDWAKGTQTDLRSFFKPGGEVPHLTYTFRQPGMHIVSLVSTDTLSILPSIRFNDYIAVEGLTPAINARSQTQSTNNNGRELYSRRRRRSRHITRGGWCGLTSERRQRRIRVAVRRKGGWIGERRLPRRAGWRRRSVRRAVAIGRVTGDRLRSARRRHNSSRAGNGSWRCRCVSVGV